MASVTAVPKDADGPESNGAASHETGTDKSGANAPSTYRLVIRAEIIPEETTDRLQLNTRWDHRAIALAVGGLATLLALSWLGLSRIGSDGSGTDADSTLSASEHTRDVVRPSSAQSSAPSEAATPRPPAASIAEERSTAAPVTHSAETKSVGRVAPTETDTSPRPINEVIPSVPRSARETIRGTVRVSIQVTVDRQGAVIAAASQDPGPSRYFERLALEASRQWTFVPAATEEHRVMLVRFNFTRAGTTAGASPLR